MEPYKEEQIALRLLNNFSTLTGVMKLIASDDRKTNWEAVRKTCVNYIDRENHGILEDMKELEEIATRKAVMNND